MFFCLLVWMPLYGICQEDSFLVLSDVHLNMRQTKGALYYNGDDIDNNLFDRVLSSIQLGKAKYILSPGDFMWHADTEKKPLDDMKKVYGRITHQLHDEFPKAKMVAAMGNNDFMTDYEVDNASCKLFHEYMLAGLSKDGTVFKKFDELGCYYYDIDADIRIIVLNTTLFTKRCTNCDAKAQKQLKWLDSTLSQSSNKKVWLLYHVPPGLDRYMTYDVNKDNILKNKHTYIWNLTQSYQDSFYKKIETYKDIIKFQLAGHTHMDDYLVLSEEDKLTDTSTSKRYIHIVPGLDMKHGNNPAYQMIHYDRTTGYVTQIVTHYIDSNYKWHVYVFHDFTFKRLNSSDDAAYRQYFTMRKPPKNIFDNATYKQQSIININAK